MKAQKSILKTCAVLMAAEMALSPITVKAATSPGWDIPDPWAEAIPIGETGIAEEDVAYKIPSYSYAWNDSTDEEGYRNGTLYVRFERDSSDSFFCGTIPNGYKGISTPVYYQWEAISNDNWYGDDLPNFYDTMDADNSQNWTETDDIDGSGNWDTSLVTKYNFTVDCNGTLYSECWMAFSPELGAGRIEAVVPQQYDGAITFTINGVKLENGEAVKDDNASITYYLQGNGASAAQAATPEPAADPQQDAIPQPTEPESAPQPTEPAQPAADTQRTYVTKSGDNLMKLAKELYGDKALWTTIYELNKDQIKNPNVIYANMELVLP